MTNVFTVDLEEWFCFPFTPKDISTGDWEQFNSRVTEPTLKLLNLLEKKNIRATFFVLGWIADKLPDLVTEIINKNHEIACHSYNHRLITKLTPSQFDEDLDKALNSISKVCSQQIKGYRAPVFTITKYTLWALNIMSKYGIKYDSSVYPTFFHPDYGINDSPLLPYQINGIWEVPLSCIRIGGISVPISGGGYFRLYPYKLTEKMIRGINKSQRAYIFYIHPWELDLEQPKANLSLWGKFRHYQNLSGNYEKLEKLLDNFKFSSMDKLLEGKI